MCLPSALEDRTETGLAGGLGSSSEKTGDDEPTSGTRRRSSAVDGKRILVIVRDNYRNIRGLPSPGQRSSHVEVENKIEPQVI